MSALLLTGEPGTGKSTLLRQILAAFAKNRPVCGFCTKKNEDGRVYLYSAASAPVFDEAHLAGEIFGAGEFTAHSEAFDTLGVELLTDIPENAVVVMDELGFLESSSARFRSAVLSVLRSNVTVLGVIKPKNLPFLNEIRALPGVRLLTVTQENRDSLLREAACLMDGK